ncbi:arrestin domain-containing protein 3-like [Mytilus californianus]|uniref:arrestin domain-containing protein 3-like n=1 Tax=Mytilus californianus TaxID=6549 RepID=UPI002246EFA2|nr:arrestin domain-containing protein 3-like [Mytilus californianus]
MVKLKTFEIILSASDGFFMAGEILQGYVTVELKYPMKMQAIRVFAKGKAFVHWTEQKMRGPGQSRYKDIKHHHATEEYFDFHTAVLKNHEKCGTKFVLPAGKYSYPFRFQLPSSLPSSYEGEYGYVRYYVKAAIMKPWRIDHVAKTAFTVSSVLDLNSLPQASKSIQKSATKQLCCLCCSSGPITTFLSIDRHGFVPGEPITVNAEIENLSGRKIRSSSVTLKMKTTFHTTQQTRTTSSVITQLRHSCIGKGQTDTWNGEQMFVPAIPPSYLLGCNIIEINYVLEFRVDPIGPALELYIPVNIIIGTIPLSSSVKHYLRFQQPHSSNGYGATNNMPMNRLSLQTVNAEYILGSVNIKEEDDPEYTRGQLRYTPVYTYYIWGG